MSLAESEETIMFTEKYSLSQKYIFYPAQFWPHKNHKLIVKSLAILKKEDLDIKAVFVGERMKKWGEYERVIKLANKLKVKKQIKWGPVHNFTRSQFFNKFYIRIYSDV